VSLSQLDNEVICRENISSGASLSIASAMASTGKLEDSAGPCGNFAFLATAGPHLEVNWDGKLMFEMMAITRFQSDAKPQDIGRTGITGITGVLAKASKNWRRKCVCLRDPIVSMPLRRTQSNPINK
jgi:hypothetical protein